MVRTHLENWEGGRSIKAGKIGLQKLRILGKDPIRYWCGG